MSISLYAASIPVFQQMLGSLDACLAKAEQKSQSANIEPQAYLHARLFPDMLDLTRQVQIACDFARGVSARLAGVEVPKVADTAQSFSDLHELIEGTRSFLSSLAASQIDGQEAREIVLRAGTPKERKFAAQAYLLSYGLPQFFFHVTTAYALLRHNGIVIGKTDFMGAY